LAPQDMLRYERGVEETDVVITGFQCIYF